MVDLANSMDILVSGLSMLPDFQTGQVLRNITSSPLGRVTLAGFIKHGRGVAPWRVFGSYAVLLVLEGGGCYRDDNCVDQGVGIGDVIVVYPDLGHCYGPESGEVWSEFYIVFDGPVFDLWRKKGILDPRAPIHHVEPVEYWLRRFTESVTTDATAETEQGNVHICRVQQVLADMFASERKRALGKSERTWLDRARALLDAGPKESLALENIAEELGTSYETFRKKFVKLTVASPASYRMRRAIDRACELMQQQRLTNKEIAARPGFSGEFHFSRRFKQCTGLAPREFRSQLAGRERK